MFQNFVNFVVKAVINKTSLKKDKVIELGGLVFVSYDLLKINIFVAVDPESVFQFLKGGRLHFVIGAL